MIRSLLAAATALVLFSAPWTQDKAQTRPEVGKPAPTARLNDHKGAIVSIGGKHKNWSVLAFFPKAATPG